MSCRAFSRFVEHRCLAELFERFAAKQITFDYQETNRNGPFREFLLPLTGGAALSREVFFEKCNL
jgi:predicted enzyme involved in methoxymalonyl-ACP biosynthesis